MAGRMRALSAVKSFAAAGDVLRQSLRTQARGDAVKPGLMRAQIGDEARAEALSGAVEALLRALQQRFETRQAPARGAQFGAAAL